MAELRHGKVCCERGLFAFLPTMPTPENMEDYVGERALRARTKKWDCTALPASLMQQTLVKLRISPGNICFLRWRAPTRDNDR
jgi:hypothetical protein